MAAECSRHHDLEKILQGESAEPCNLPFQMLQDSTNNFSEDRVLGQGGFGVVYKGVLRNGKVIAVKKVVFRQGKDEKQFKNELTHLMRLKNKNIVRLVGYCYEIKKILFEIEGNYHFADMAEMLLCLEFVPEGSLENHISDEWRGLDWQTRCKIIVGICHGLYYLHDNNILHLDLKPANILLDCDMVPKITDFGLSRLLEQSRIYTNTRAGTLGYMAPEYLNKGEISIKSDIFSAGVVIIEIIVGHKNYPDSGTPTQDFVEHVLQNWTKRLVEQKCTSLEKDSQQIKVFIEIGLRCVHTDPAKRPTTREIIECLESMNLHVSNEKWTRIDTVHQKHANTPKAALSNPSPGKKSQMKRRCSETDPNCMEMDSVKRPATMVSIERLNELRLSADQPMVAPEMRYRPRHVNDDHQQEWVDNRHHGPRRAPSVCILTVAFFFFK